MTTAIGEGRLGQQIPFGDDQEIERLLLPFTVTSKLLLPLIEATGVAVQGDELGIEVAPGYFQLQDVR